MIRGFTYFKKSQNIHTNKAKAGSAYLRRAEARNDGSVAHEPQDSHAAVKRALGAQGRHPIERFLLFPPHPVALLVVVRAVHLLLLLCVGGLY